MQYMNMKYTGMKGLDFETYEVTSEEGNANYVGGNGGDIINGQSESKETD